MPFEAICFTVVRIDGDYAHLLKEDAAPGEEPRCVAMAMLPPEIMEGSLVIYEMLEYRMA